MTGEWNGVVRRQEMVGFNRKEVGSAVAVFTESQPYSWTQFHGLGPHVPAPSI